MNRRLQQFLELENLTPARLADTLGIQRSGLSHILSGRNNPGYDFIYKLITKFPSINAEWLLTGEGKIYKDLNGTTTAKEGFSTPPNSNYSGHSLFDAPDKQAHNPILITNNQSISDKNKEFKLPENHVESNSKESAPKNKSIKRVIVFYSDGSFEELFPNLV